jgi:hypothetical protein
MWTSVASGSASPESLLVALRAGRSIAVRGSRDSHGMTNGELESLAIVGDTLRVSFSSEVRELRFIADGGRQVAVRRGRSGTYVLTPQDSYIRIVATTADATFYLNPVIRHTGGGVLHQDARPVQPVLWSLRLLLWGMLGFPALRLLQVRRRPRRSARGIRALEPLSRIGN